MSGICVIYRFLKFSLPDQLNSTDILQLCIWDDFNIYAQKLKPVSKYLLTTSYV